MRRWRGSWCEGAFGPGTGAAVGRGAAGLTRSATRVRVGQAVSEAADFSLVAASVSRGEKRNNDRNSRVVFMAVKCRWFSNGCAAAIGWV